MYCPKCEKTISRERLEEIERELRERFDNQSISQGLCPVCGTRLIDLKEER
jgi:ssDNA-binding Zn-finger/Zn-ribbon topoisomerase 1